MRRRRLLPVWLLDMVVREERHGEVRRKEMARGGGTEGAETTKWAFRRWGWQMEKKKEN